MRVVGLFDVLRGFAAAGLGGVTLALAFVHVVGLVVGVVFGFVVVVFEVDLGFTFFLFFGHAGDLGFLFIDDVFVDVF